MATETDTRIKELRPLKGTALPNLFIDINGQTKSSLSQADIDPKLKTADQLLFYREGLTRNVEAASVNNLFASGELEADHIEIGMLRTDVITYLEQMMANGTNLAKITVYRTEIIGGKMCITDEYMFENCFITSLDAFLGQSRDSLQTMWGDQAHFEYRYLKRTHTINIYDQLGASQGSKVSTIDFQTGILGGAS